MKMKHISVLSLALLTLMLGAVMVQAQDSTATPEPTLVPTTEPTLEPTVEATAEPVPAWVRFVNWTADGAAVDVWVNGEVAAANLAALTETGYQSYAAGDYSFAAVASGAATDSAMLTADLALAEGGRYTVAVVGSSVNGTVMAVLSVDDYSAIPFGYARLYIYHAVEGAANVDLFANGEMVITELGYPGTFTDLSGATNDGAFAVDLPAGTYDFSVRLTENSAVTGMMSTPDATSTDTADDTATETMQTMTDVPGLVDLPGVMIEAGTIYTIAVVPAGDGVQVYTSSMAGVAAAQANALDVALRNPDLSVFVAAVRAADPAILDALSADGTLTIFAPTNAAFDAFLNDMAMTTDDLFANTELLNAVLTYHVLGTSQDVAALGSSSGASVAPMQGEPITVAVDEAGTITLNSTVHVIGPDIAVRNGFVHIVDGVLVPPSLVPAS